MALALIFTAFNLSAQSDFDLQFKNYNVVTIDLDSKLTKDNILNQVKNNINGPIELNLFGYEVTLVKQDIIAWDYISQNSDGTSVAKGKRAIPFYGHTKKGGKVSITLAKDFIYGFIVDGNNTKFIEPARYYDVNASKNEFVIYNSTDVKEGAPKTCGVTEMAKKITDIPKKITGQCYDIEYAICNDYSMVNKYGSTAGAENHAIGVTNNVNTSYDTEFADQLTFVIQGQYNSTCPSCDPWSSTTNANDLLASFRVWAAANLNITHDVASLWTNRDFDGSTIGIAYVGAVCVNGWKYNCLQDWSTNASLKRVMVSHELGHNFNAVHDTPSGFIMSSSVADVTTWSNTSITAIEAFYNSISCLSVCAGSVPLIQFQEETSTTPEHAVSGTTGACNEPFSLIQLNVNTNIAPSNNVVLNVNIDTATNALQDYDYELLTTSITFTPGGALTQTVDIRVIDDQVEELTENLILNLVISSGTANMGPFDSHNLSIIDSKDEVSSNCCSGGASITYGNHNYNAITVFQGGVEDSRSRTIILASELTAAGLGAGNITQLSLNVVTKTSNAPFQDFRIGMENVANTSPTGMNWIATTEVFLASVTTATSWNDFNFSNYFYWDGTSNLYIQFCFNNSTAVGADHIMHTTPAVSNVNMINYQINNNADGCNAINTNTTYSYNVPIQPRLKLAQAGGAIVEIGSGQTSSSRLKVGETAHFYTSNDKVIASVSNTGNTDIDCITSTITTAGNGKLTAGFGTGDYTQKTFEISGNASATYDVTLYYTDDELAIWGAEKLNLFMVKSDVILSSATESDVTIISPTIVETEIGAGSQISYKGSFTGFSHFALTDIEGVQNFLFFDDADFAIIQNPNGLIFNNSNGSKYILTVNSSGTLLVNSSSSAGVKAILQTGDLCLNLSGKGIILQRPNGAFTKITIDNNGGIITTNFSNLPIPLIKLNTGNFEIDQNGKGVILTNAQNECWRLYIDTGGNLTTQLINCP